MHNENSAGNAAPQPFLASNQTAPAYWMLDILWTILATGQQTGGRYSVLEQIMPGNAAPPPHVHPFSVEAFYLLDGEITYKVGDATLSAKTGSFVVVPRNTVHSFTVTSASAHVLNLYLPAGWEQVFPDLTRPAERRELPPPGQDDIHSANVTRFLNNYWGNIADVAYARQHFAPTLGSERPALNPTIPAAPLAIHRNDAPAFAYRDMVWAILADAATMEGMISLVEVACPKGSGLPAHQRDSDVAFYVTNGQITVTTEGETFTAAAGSLVCVPAGATHSFDATNDSRFLYFGAPGGLEELIRPLGTALSARG